MKTLLKKEFNTHGQNKLLYIVLLVVGMMQVFLARSLFGAEGGGALAKTIFQDNSIIYSLVATIFTPIIAVVLGYYFISSEFEQRTWEMYFLGIKNKSKILWTKYVVCLFYWIAYNICVWGIFLGLSAFYWQRQVDLFFVWLIPISTTLLGLFLFTAQLSMHFLIPNTQISISIVMVFIGIVGMVLESWLIYVLPLSSGFYLNHIDQFNNLEYIRLIIQNIIFSIILISTVIKQFKL